MGAPDHLQVKESFSTIFNNVPVTYHQGEPVHADDPVAKKWPEYFEPLRFAHDPVVLEQGEPEPPATISGTGHVVPEVTYADLQAEAKTLGIPANGTRAELEERIAEERERLATPQETEGTPETEPETTETPAEPVEA